MVAQWISVGDGRLTYTPSGDQLAKFDQATSELSEAQQAAYPITDPITGQARLAADLVLEGGGVKGIALAGAVLVLDKAGYMFPRVAGTSAGAIAAALILTAHLALRPVDRRIDRLPAAPDSEVETTYSFRAVTRAADEAHIRTLLVRELTGEDFVLHSVRSHDLDGGSGLVEITAEVRRHGHDDLALEAAVSRLSLEPAVSSVTWTTTEPEPTLITAEE